MATAEAMQQSGKKLLVEKKVDKFLETIEMVGASP